MPREYRHIKQYEKEILELKAEGLTLREIGEKLGFSRKQIDKAESIYMRATKPYRDAENLISQAKNYMHYEELEDRYYLLLGEKV